MKEYEIEYKIVFTAKIKVQADGTISAVNKVNKIEIEKLLDLDKGDATFEIESVAEVGCPRSQD